MQDFKPFVYGDANLLAMIIGGRNAEQVAENICDCYGNAEKFGGDGDGGALKEWYDDIQFQDLLKFEGVTERAARAIMAALEIGRRINTRAALGTERKLNDPRKVYDYFRPLMLGKAQEEFHVCYLNVKNQLLGEREIARGNIAACPVSIQEIMKWGIRFGAASLILVHNHPSGDPTPSDTDIRLTRKTAAAGDLMGMQVVDHVIIGRNSYTSLHDMDII